MKNKFYLTAAIPYVNARPHIGHVLEFVQGDVLARHNRRKGKDVFYITGGDENSLKNVRAAEEEGVSVAELCARNSEFFKKIAADFNISLDNFQRSSLPNHIESSQDLWRRCAESGDIYKKRYEGLYCVGCEAFYTPDELNNGECFEHPGKKLELVEEENYFFKLSKYTSELKKIIESDEYLVSPESKKNETLGFIEKGLEDFSISRSNERAHGWGVSVPGDESQKMYVWFDALNVYRSAAPEWWPADVHLIGKGILRFHSIYWPAILLSAKLPLPKKLLVHGYITVNGQKMSKSIGNVIDPSSLIPKYGVDAIRYHLLKEIPSFGDGDFSEAKLQAVYNSDLANGLGNYASRVLTLGSREEILNKVNLDEEVSSKILKTKEDVEEKIEAFRLNEALFSIWSLISFGDEYVNKKEVWKIADTTEKNKALYNLSTILIEVVDLLEPFLPETSAKIKQYINISPDGFKLTKPTPLFPRI
jgi:methionyl-tRNA synthetase